MTPPAVPASKPPVAAAAGGGRGNLLAAIQQGKSLKKTVTRDPKPLETTTAPSSTSSSGNSMMDAIKGGQSILKKTGGASSSPKYVFSVCHVKSYSFLDLRRVPSVHRVFLLVLGDLQRSCVRIEKPRQRKPGRRRFHHQRDLLLSPRHLFLAHIVKAIGAFQTTVQWKAVWRRSKRNWTNC